MQGEASEARPGVVAGTMSPRPMVIKVSQQNHKDSSTCALRSLTCEARVHQGPGLDAHEATGAQSQPTKGGQEDEESRLLGLGVLGVRELQEDPSHRVATGPPQAILINIG